MLDELRPEEVIWAYWAQVAVLEERAIRLAPLYMVVA